jgi:hypothetical protein
VEEMHTKRFFQKNPLLRGIGRLTFLCWVLTHWHENTYSQAGGSAAAVSSQTRQDNQLTRQVQDSETKTQGDRSEEKKSVTAQPLSQGLGEVQIMTEEQAKPWFFATVDCQAFYNSNVLYASSISNTFGAWQIITTPEIGFAPTIQDEKFSKFFPKAGFRYQFFTYAQAEPYPSSVANSSAPGQPYTIAQQNFRISNPYASLGWAFSDDLYLEFSAQANLYTSNNPYTSPSNFLNEYPIAWQASWFRPFADIHSFSITGRASYVFAWSPPQGSIEGNNQFSRTDNNLTFAWACSPIREISTQVYASFRLAKYTGSDNNPNTSPFSSLTYIDESDRLDFQQTYGASVTYSPIEYLSVRAFVSWTKSDTSIPEPITGQFEAYNAGTGLNLIYRF